MADTRQKPSKMRIRIKGKLPDHIKDMGVRANQRYDAEYAPGTRLDAVRIQVPVEDHYENCTLLEDYYTILK
jgi:hypothetical protein